MLKLLIEKRKITILIFVMLVLYGAFSFTEMPRQYMPDVVVKIAVVTTVYPGATPDVVEQTVTKQLEQAIKKVEGVEKIISTSASNVSVIQVHAYDDANAKETWSDLRAKVDDIANDLPEGAYKPEVNSDLASTFLGTYVIYSDSIDNLYPLHADMIKWKDQLQAVAGISDVSITGIPDQEVQIRLDPKKLQAYAIPWEQVLQAVQNAVDLLPLGDLTYDDRTYQLLIKEIDDSSTLNDIIISKNQMGVPIYLKDIGESKLALKEPDTLSYYDGKPAIMITVDSVVNSDIISLDRDFNNKLEDLVESLPANVTFLATFQQANMVSETLGNLSKELAMAIVLVIALCILGLSYLSAFFVALAIPISITVGMVFVSLTGTSLNEISIVGLIIVLGILVDDAIVVNDNIDRRFKVLGEDPKTAAIEGAREVAVSILTATLTIVFAFTPLLFLSGDVGAFIKPIPIMIIFTMLASMAMSLTIIPIFREWYDNRRLRKSADIKNEADGILGKQIQQATDWYATKLLPKLLKKPMRTAGIGLLLGSLTFLLVLVIPIELFPEAEEPNVNIQVQLPIGVSMDKLDEVTREMMAWLQMQPETELVSATVAGKAPDLFLELVPVSINNTSAQISVLGKEGVFDLAITVDAWKNQLEAMYPQASIIMKTPRLGVPVGSPVSIRVEGEDLDVLQDLAQDIKALVAATPGTTGVRDDLGIERYTLEFIMNKQAMDQYMVDYQAVTRALRLVSSGIELSNFNTGNEIIDITLYIDSDSSDPNLIFQQLNVTNALGAQIPLSHIAEMKPTFSIQKIHRENMVRSVTIEANVFGRTATEVNNELKLKLDNMDLPQGYSWEFGGEMYEQDDIFNDLAHLFLIVVFIIFTIITIQFYSFTTPVIVMTTVYLAASGGIMGIFVSGSPIGFMSIMGIIALAGIVVRNGIVLIEFIEHARQDQGLDLKDAVIGSAAARFRPILLTSITAVFGILPLALGKSLLFHPMAYTIIFGLSISTFLTLLVVPSLYMTVEGIKEERRAKKLMKAQ